MTNEIKAIIYSALQEVSEGKVDADDLELQDDLRIDFLDRLIICTKLKEKLNVEIPEQSVREFRIVKDIVDCVESIIKWRGDERNKVKSLG